MTKYVDTCTEWKISYHVWSADGRLVALRWREKHTSVWFMTPGTGLMQEWFCDRTYWLRRVHVWITPREVRSVCGQHDFIDLLRLNNAIFCRDRQEKTWCHCHSACTAWGERHPITGRCREGKRQRAAHTETQNKGSFKIHEQSLYNILTCNESPWQPYLLYTAK